MQASIAEFCEHGSGKEKERCQGDGESYIRKIGTNCQANVFVLDLIEDDWGRGWMGVSFNL
jgi:hypothetical protein